MRQHTTPRHSARYRHCMAMLLLCFTGSAGAVPDILASPSGTSMVDIEFDTAGQAPRYVYCQPTPNGGGADIMYRGAVGSGGQLIPQASAVGSCTFASNGPEWGRDASGTFIAYMDTNNNQLTVKFIRPDGPLGWTQQQVGGLPLLAPAPNIVYPSQYTGSTARLVFMAQASNGTLTTQGLNGAFQCSLLTQGLTGNGPHFSSYENFLMYTKVANGARQVFKANMASCTSTQLTNDPSPKSTVTAWTAPEAGIGNVFGVLMGDNGTATEYDVFREDGTLWTAITASGQAFSSPETFQYGNSSYLLYVSRKAAGNYGIFVANIGTGVTVEMSDSQTAMVRSEPEVGFLPGNGGPRIYYSATDPLTGTPNAVFQTGQTTLP